MRSLNHRNRSKTGSRIHRLIEARANCVPDPGPEEFDRELKQIMAPRPRTLNEDLPGRTWRWRLPGTRLALGGILVGASAAVAWIAAVGSSSTVLISLVGALVGVLAGGMVCVRSLHSAIADDIWNYLGKRSAVKSRVQLEKARNDGTQKLITLLQPGMVLTEGGPDWHREIRVPEAPPPVMPQPPTPPLPADELEPPARNETDPARRQAQEPMDKPS
jgi:hypothetical protein